MSRSGEATNRGPRHGETRHRRRRRENGSATVELVLVTPLLILLLLLAVAAGRLGQTRNDVYKAAGDAARAASLRQHPGTADRDARRTAERSLAGRGVTCQRLGVHTDAGDLRPGGRIVVTVSCQVGLADLGLLGLPGSRTIAARSVAVVDRYRSS